MINEIKRTKENSNSGIMSNLFRHVVAHPISEMVVSIEELMNWVENMRRFKKEQVLVISQT